MKDPIPTFSYLVAAIKSRFPDLAYIHIVEPRISGAQTADESDSAEESNDFIRELWAPRPLVSAGGYTREDAIKTSEAKGDFIAMGRYFISNVGPFVHLQCKDVWVLMLILMCVCAAGYRGEV